MKLSGSPRRRLESQKHKRRDKSKIDRSKCPASSNQIADLRRGTPRSVPLPYTDVKKSCPDLHSSVEREANEVSEIRFQKILDQLPNRDPVYGDDPLDVDETCLFSSGGAREMRDCFMKLLQLVPLDDTVEDDDAHESLNSMSSMTPVPSLTGLHYPSFLCPSVPKPSGGRRISKLQLLQGTIDYILDLESTLENRAGPSECSTPIGPLVFPLTNEERGFVPVLDSDLSRQVYCLPPSR